jgi:tetratricopeptide (TPR) repeat protein
MNFKTILILILLVAAIAAGAIFFTRYQQVQAQKEATQLLLQAEALLSDQAYEKAVATLKDLTQRFPQFNNMPQALYDLGRAYKKIAPEQALTAWEKLLEQFPQSNLSLDTHHAAGWLALDQGKTEQAMEHFQALKTTHRTELQKSAQLGLAAIAEARGDYDEAREAYYGIIGDATSGEGNTIISQAMDRLSDLNTELFLSPRVTEFSQRYEVQPGDNPISMAARFDTTAYLVQEINDIEASNRIRAGMRITVPKPGGVELVVDKSDRHLYVFSNMEGTEGKFFKRYLVGVAKYAERTPPGIYVIDDKQINPTWYPPGGGVVGPGDPENALGTRWMGFTRDGRDTSLGIHGNNAPETIGTDASAGCIRMYNAEVEELFKIARKGTEVEIIE